MLHGRQEEDVGEGHNGRDGQQEGQLRALVADRWGSTLIYGAAAKAINFGRLGKKVRTGTFGNIKVG